MASVGGVAIVGLTSLAATGITQRRGIPTFGAPRTSSASSARSTVSGCTNKRDVLSPARNA
jgi:hypothetical protein